MKLYSALCNTMDNSVWTVWLFIVLKNLCQCVCVWGGLCVCLQDWIEQVKNESVCSWCVYIYKGIPWSVAGHWTVILLFCTVAVKFMFDYLLMFFIAGHGCKLVAIVVLVCKLRELTDCQLSCAVSQNFLNQNKISDLKLINVNYKISYLKLIDVNYQIDEYKWTIPFYCFSTCLSLKSVALTTFVLNSK